MHSVRPSKRQPMKTTASASTGFGRPARPESSQRSWRSALRFLVVASGISLAAEYLSTHTGFPYGRYDYIANTHGSELYISNIPLFVPPGHVLLFFLGVQLSERLPEGSEWWIAAIAGLVVGLFAWTGHDTMGPVLYAFFLACLLVSPSRRLYATMFVLSLGLELYGTWVGNWVWASDVPWTPLRQENPPLASGAFYCVLDLLVVSFATFSRRQAPA